MGKTTVCDSGNLATGSATRWLGKRQRVKREWRRLFSKKPSCPHWVGRGWPKASLSYAPLGAACPLTPPSPAIGERETGTRWSSLQSLAPSSRIGGLIFTFRILARLVFFGARDNPGALELADSDYPLALLSACLVAARSPLFVCAAWCSLPPHPALSRHRGEGDKHQTSLLVFRIAIGGLIFTFRIPVRLMFSGAPG